MKWPVTALSGIGCHFNPKGFWRIVSVEMWNPRKTAFEFTTGVRNKVFKASKSLAKGDKLSCFALPIPLALLIGRTNRSRQNELFKAGCSPRFLHLLQKLASPFV